MDWVEILVQVEHLTEGRGLGYKGYQVDWVEKHREPAGLIGSVYLGKELLIEPRLSEGDIPGNAGEH